MNVWMDPRSTDDKKDDMPCEHAQIDDTDTQRIHEQTEDEERESVAVIDLGTDMNVLESVL